jgi:hypothetical protein
MLQELLPPFIWLLELAFVVLSVGGAWRVFERAGQPGWAVLVPFYNAVVLCRAAQRPDLTLLLFLPCANVVGWIAVSILLARRFGKGVAFGLGLAFLPFAFYPLLAASDRPAVAA